MLLLLLSVLVNQHHHRTLRLDSFETLKAPASVQSCLNTEHCLPVDLFTSLISAILQKYLDNFDLSIKVIYIVGTLGFSVGQLLRIR